MKLAALYIENSFFDKPQMINFGGANLYYVDEDFNIKFKPNEKYIKDFYSINNDVVRMISAVVGKNGSGKTTLLKFIADSFNNYSDTNFYRIYEDGAKIYIDEKNYKNLKTPSNWGIDSFDFQTIYYSPFLDFKEKKDVLGIDISYDFLLQEDLKELTSIDNAKPDPFRVLRKNNVYRQLEFIASDYANILREIFGLPDYENFKITFTRHRIDADSERINFINTPLKFQEELQSIFRQIREEYEIEENNKNSPKALLKNLVLMDIFCILINKLEIKTEFIEKGALKPVNTFRTNALESFYSFLDRHFYLTIGSSKKYKLLPLEETKYALNKIYAIIDSRIEYDDSTVNQFKGIVVNEKENYIYVNLDETKELLTIHDNFLDKVDSFHLPLEIRDKHNNQFTFERVRGFINFEPSNRKLSSGESSLLNFYSRLYYYFKKNLIDIKKDKLFKNYILLLDEPDLGFHPEWKREFISSLTIFLEKFFNKIGSKVQVIFTTHDALTLSDIPNYNIVYLNEFKPDNWVLHEPERPIKSFGANITDLLAHSFFIKKGGLIGGFAKGKIEDVINFLRDRESKIDSPKKCKEIIEIIDEPLLQRKLAEMYDEKYSEKLELSLLKKEQKFIADMIKKKSNKTKK